MAFLHNSVVKFNVTLHNSMLKMILFFSGYMDNSCLPTAMFVKEADDVCESLSGVTLF